MEGQTYLTLGKKKRRRKEGEKISIVFMKNPTLEKKMPGSLSWKVSHT